MSDIWKYVLEFISGLGGGMVVVIIVLKFMKERIATLVDKEIELRTSKALEKYKYDLEKTKMAYSKNIDEEWKSLIHILRETQAMKVFLGQLLKAIKSISSQSKPYSFVARELKINECEIVKTARTLIG